MHKISSGLSLGMLKGMFDAADTDKDGLVSYSEFKAVMLCR